MVIETQLLQEKCKKILEAITTKTAKNKISSDTIELEIANGALYLNATDKEYFVSVKLPLEGDLEEFHAVIPSARFLDLVTRTTSKTITMKVTSNYLMIKGNGAAKEPLIYNGTKLVEVPRITIDNVTNEFTIKNSLLQSVLKYNDKILYTEGHDSFPVFYIDNEGAITVSKSACINSFTLEQPVSLILSEKLVKLFKLFKAEDIKFTMGFDTTPNGITQQKVMFFDGSVMLTAILNTDTKIVRRFPVKAIRARAEQVAPYSVVLNKNVLLSAIERISLYKDSIESCIQMNFMPNDLTMNDIHKAAEETITYVNNCPALPAEGYSAKFNVDDLLLVLNMFDDEFLTVHFGDNAIALVKANIKYMLPECEYR